MLLSLILMIIAPAVGAEACEHMASETMPSEQREASSPEQTLSDIVNQEHATGANRSVLHDVDGCLPRCCQGSGCCHLMAISPLATLWRPRVEMAVTMVTAEVPRRSNRPDLPPPKAI